MRFHKRQAIDVPTNFLSFCKDDRLLFCFSNMMMSVGTISNTVAEKDIGRPSALCCRLFPFFVILLLCLARTVIASTKKIFLDGACRIQ